MSNNSTETPFPTDAALVKRYYELCDKRDALYAGVQPIEDKLTAVNAQIEVLRVEQAALSTQIDDGLGRQAFLTLKSEIRQIASYLRKIPPRE